MRYFSFKSLLILGLLLIFVLSQRGGGSRSSSRSRSSRSSSRSFGYRSSRRRGSGSGFSWWPFGEEENKTLANETTNSTEEGEEESSDGLGYGWIGIFLSVFAGLAYIGSKSEQKTALERKEKL